MPFVKVSVEQLRAAQELYAAVTKFVNSDSWPGKLQREEMLEDNYSPMLAALNHCKEEYEKHGC